MENIEAVFMLLFNSKILKKVKKEGVEDCRDSNKPCLQWDHDIFLKLKHVRGIKPKTTFKNSILSIKENLFGLSEGRQQFIFSLTVNFNTLCKFYF